MQVRDTNKSRRSIGVLAVICAVVQLALAPNIGIAAGRANVALVFVGLVALSIGGRTGVLAGFFGGLFFDLCTTGPMGLMTLLLTITSYVLGMEERNRLADELTGSLALFAGTDVIVSLIYGLAMLLVGQASSVGDVLASSVLPSALLTLICFVIFEYFLVGGFSGAGIGGGGRRGGGHYKLSGL